MSNIEIAILVASEMGLSYEAIITPNRVSKLVDCRRMIALILANRGVNSQEIGQVLSRDRTTILHHIDTMKSYLMIYQSYRNTYQSLMQKIESHENQTQ